MLHIRYVNWNCPRPLYMYISYVYDDFDPPISPDPRTSSMPDWCSCGALETAFKCRQNCKENVVCCQETVLVNNSLALIVVTVFPWTNVKIIRELTFPDVSPCNPCFNQHYLNNWEISLYKYLLLHWYLSC